MSECCSICILTMGCAKNEVDSRDMANRLEDAGHRIVQDIDQCDIAIVNTCGFIQSATEESLEAIFDIADIDRFSARHSRIIVAGCLPSRYGDDLSAELDEASAFVPCSKEDDIVAVVASLDITPHTAAADTLPLSKTFSAYVKISDGCDRFCTYCTIPFIRGAYHSFPLDDVMRDVDARIAEGAREIVFIAQDTGRWGEDLPGVPQLCDLLAQAAQKHSDTWFRVMYLQPAGLDDDLLNVVAAYPNICNYFDIPLQHSNARILKAMNRSGSGDEYLQLVSRVRERIPDVVLRTTLIAGFPGESEDDFEDLCDFVAQARFDYVGVFPYSQEEGTKAADLDGQIDEDTKLERAQALRDIADTASVARIGARVGSVEDILVLGFEEDGQLYGRSMGQAPEVDGVVFVDDGEPGAIVIGRIVDTLWYDMEAERV